MDILEIIIEHNYKALEKVEFDQSNAKNLFTISHNGTSIFDFLHDESLMDEVNPYQYYGIEKIKDVIQLWEIHHNIMGYIECSESFVGDEGINHFYTVNPKYINLVFLELKKRGYNPQLFTHQTGLIDILVIEEY